MCDVRWMLTHKANLLKGEMSWVVQGGLRGKHDKIAGGWMEWCEWIQEGGR